MKGKTLIEKAREGKAAALIKRVAADERFSAALLAKRIASGRAVIPANKRHTVKKPCGIGEGLRVKVNANIGTSTEYVRPRQELAKLRTAVGYGADTIMDLSVGGDLRKIRGLLLKHTTVPLGTVPVYEAAVRAEKKYGTFLRMQAEDIFDVLREQAEAGVDFFTLHCGITRKTLRSLTTNPRIMGIVSRGGAITANWMKANKAENPLFERFDKVLDILKPYDVTLSLGDGLRPGSVLDATDRPQIAELKLLGTLAQQALRNGIQVMIEGPGHIPLHEIEKNIRMEKTICRRAPFYVLGPLVTDFGMGYDHITAAIGSAVAAMHGADFLCFVTPAEHVCLPDTEDIKLGVIASRIAAHSADLARNNRQAWNDDLEMSRARIKRNWPRQIRMSLDPQLVEKKRRHSPSALKDVCTMCGKYCSIKLMEKCTKLK